MIMHDTVYKGGDVTDALITTSFDTEARNVASFSHTYCICVVLVVLFFRMLSFQQ